MQRGNPVNNNDIGCVWDARDAAEATERALREALPEWDRTVTSDHYVFTLVDDDGTWTIHAGVCNPHVAVYQPSDITGAPLAQFIDLSPSLFESTLVAIGVPEVGAGVLVP
jgi:hypothetical protein